MALEIRTALPNSVRVSGNQYIEFIPTTGGGRYRVDGPGNVLDFTFAGIGGGNFDVLGPGVSVSAGDHLVIFNTLQTRLDAYDFDASSGAAATPTNGNRREIDVAASSSNRIYFLGGAFPFESPSQRFHIVPASSGPVTFGCTATGELRRYTGYATGAADWNPGAASQPAPPAPATPPASRNALLASGSTCFFDYQAVSIENGLVTLRLTLTDGPSGESVTLHQQLHVDNSP